MRRPFAIAILGLALVALVGVPAAAARPAASFESRASDARPGGTMRVAAHVRHPHRNVAFGASAVVHFACGDVSVTLERVEDRFVARGGVPVGPGEVPGEVAVDVTIEYGGQTVVVPATSTIRVPRRAAPPADCGIPQQEN